jgi:UDP-glucose 4-epimerase
MNKKTILVTGGAGHVGSHLIEQLLKNKSNIVISVDNYFNGYPENHIDGAEYRRGHTKNIENLVSETPEVVYHLGEYARIAPSFDDVEEVFDMNIVGTFSVLEFCRRRKVNKLVYAASSTKFAANGKNQNPYSFSKAQNVELIKNYGEWYGLNYAVCYFYNAFGPRENGNGKYSTMIARFQKLYSEGKPLTVDLPGTQKRNFTYVKDLANGMILAAEKGKGDGYSLNNKKEYSVLDIANAFGGEIVYRNCYSGRMDSGEIKSKARDELGWKTTLDVIDYINDFKKIVNKSDR